jgi:hypothetical protein
MTDTPHFRLREKRKPKLATLLSMPPEARGATTSRRIQVPIGGSRDWKWQREPGVEIP